MDLYKTMDYIHLTGIACYGYIGLFPEEKFLGQWFEVELKLYVDLHNASKTDNIEDTVNYGGVISLVQNLVKNAQFDLVERLAGAIADQILEHSPKISQVEVVVIKPNAPIPDFSGKIRINITRSRQ